MAKSVVKFTLPKTPAKRRSKPLRSLMKRWSRDLAAAQTVAVVEAGGRTVSLGDLIGQLRHPRRSGLVAQQAVDAFGHEALLPAPDRGLADTRRAHDLSRAQSIGSGQDDPGSPDMLLRAVAVIDDRQQALAIGWLQVNDNTCAHAEDSHNKDPMGIPQRTLMSASFH